MVKVEQTKMMVSLDNDSKRILRNLTKAVDRLARNVVLSEVEDGVTRLVEPADFTEGGYVAGVIGEEEMERIKARRPEMFEDHEM